MLFVLALLSSIAFSGCAHAPLDYDAYDYRLDGLAVGAAFPPLRDAREIGSSWRKTAAHEVMRRFAEANR